jgi:hypothetical protein
MSTKLMCDGCGHEITKFNPAKPIGDGFWRSVELRFGLDTVKWDLCDPCFERATSALAEALPARPREEWDHLVRPPARKA